jgi:hypothetical protein
MASNYTSERDARFSQLSGMVSVVEKIFEEYEKTARQNAGRVIANRSLENRCGQKSYE